MDAKKIFLYIGIGVVALIVYKKFIKKEEEPFIISQEGGSTNGGTAPVAQTKPLRVA